MKRNILTMLVLIGLTVITNAQVSINSDGSAPDPSASVDISSTTTGVLLPRMTFDQRNEISNPAEGLMIFCTNCGSFGMISVYSGGAWHTYSPCNTLSPAAGTNIPSMNQIIWNWNSVPGALGYKWNTTNNYTSATNLGPLLTKTQTGLALATSYTIFIWAYFDCGTSLALTMTATTQTCGGQMIVNHIQGSVAPVTKTVTYGTVTGVPGETSKCWITSNLGSDHQATAVNDATEPSAGWYWRFNQKQGYKNDGSILTPPWTPYSGTYEDWQPSNNPCYLEVGAGWRLPTRTEWNNVDDQGGRANWNGPWNSSLKMHAAGHLDRDDGSVAERGSVGTYWSSSKSNEYGICGYTLNFNSTLCSTTNTYLRHGVPVRCLKD